MPSFFAFHSVELGERLSAAGACIGMLADLTLPCTEQRPSLTPDTHATPQGLNFARLGAASLQRYTTAFGLELGAGCSQEDLLWAVRAHFASQEYLDEARVLLAFVQAVRRPDGAGSDTSSGERGACC